jgi:hypothetical protein
MHVTDANANVVLFAVNLFATSFFGFVRSLDVGRAVNVPSNFANLLWALRRSPFQIAMHHGLHS